MEQPGFEQPAPGQERADRGASHRLDEPSLTQLIHDVHGPA